jgi:hypothetical protein
MKKVLILGGYGNSHYFDFLATDAGGMNMIMQEKDFNDREKIIKWFIIIKNGHGPQVPTIPAIILTKKILAKQFARVGAFPCCAVIPFPYRNI